MRSTNRRLRGSITVLRGIEWVVHIVIEVRVGNHVHLVLSLPVALSEHAGSSSLTERSSHNVSLFILLNYVTCGRLIHLLTRQLRMVEVFQLVLRKDGAVGFCAESVLRWRWLSAVWCRHNIPSDSFYSLISESIWKLNGLLTLITHMSRGTRVILRRELVKDLSTANLLSIFTCSGNLNFFLSFLPRHRVVAFVCLILCTGFIRL